MERKARVKEAELLFQNNFIGAGVLKDHAKVMGIKVPENIPEIPYTHEELHKRAKDYLLVLGVSELQNNMPLTLRSLRNQFGTDPDISEPCFYNQDWYLQEDFMNTSLETKWYMIRKNIFDGSRAVNPDLLIEKYEWPSAVLCAYVFFINWFHSGEILWKHDFVWCNDKDHNGDRIYVGKYNDVAGVNKNGFSIHRHLALRNWYGSIEVV